MNEDVIKQLGSDAETLLRHQCKTIPKDHLHLPGADFVDRVAAASDRSPTTLRNLQSVFDHGRLGHTGYLSILPVDQGIEHSAGASFAPNPLYFDPENIVRLAMEGGCNAVASSVAILGAVSRKYAHKIPFIAKINHNELLTYPNHFNQTLFADADLAFDLGAVAVGATVYFGSEESDRQIEEISEVFKHAHDLGLFTVLWCYLRNAHFKTKQQDYHTAADLTGQANYLGVSLQADLIKQKLPTCNGGFPAVDFGRTHPDVYERLTSDHPIDLTRYQVANCFMGRSGLINSGGPAGDNDLQQVIKSAVINKRAGGMGLISGRKTFQKPMQEGIRLFHAIQDVYLDEDITVA